MDLLDAGAFWLEHNGHAFGHLPLIIGWFYPFYVITYIRHVFSFNGHQYALLLIESVFMRPGVLQPISYHLRNLTKE